MPKLSTVLGKSLIDPLIKGTTLRRMDLLSKDPKIMRDALTALENGGARLKQAVSRDPQLSKLTL